MKTILLAVSGGPDSMYLLNEYSNKKKYKIIACHVNYKKRKSADNDEKIVKNFCGERNIKFEKLVVTKSIENKYSKYSNFQEQAREIRYDFFKKMGNKYETNILYVGHHKDDYIETAIMQSNRANDYLFYGLKKENIFKELKIKRPLLKIYKEYILEINNDNQIPYGIDETNIDPIYERNKIRINLSKLSNKEKNDLYKHYDRLNKSKELLVKKIDKLYLKWKNNEYDIYFLNNIEIGIRKRIIYEWLIDINQNININQNKIIQIVNFIEKGTQSKKYRISQDLSITVKNKRALIV